MPEWIDKKSAVVADTVYSGSKLVARDVSFTLPGITYQTAEIQAMGPMSVPIIGLLEDMEMAITKIGIDLGLGKLSAPERQNLEFRWVQSNVKADGTTAVEGCKAFIRAMPKGVGELGVEIGNPIEAETTFGVSRMQIFYGGKEFLLVDRIAGKLRINGKDYMGGIDKLL